jgi:hypothetical protein
VWFLTPSLKINLVFYFILFIKNKIMPNQETEINSKDVVQVPDNEEEKKKQMYKIYHDAQDAQYRKRKTE